MTPKALRAENVLDELEKNRPAGKMQRRTNQLSRKYSRDTRFNRQSCCSRADHYKGVPGEILREPIWTKKTARCQRPPKHRNARENPVKGEGYERQADETLLLEDRRKDAVLGRKDIKDGGSRL